MRPLRLEVKGFTAFRDPTEVDFTDLDVFAITGPTGSGKSSLLDAMTYALYGRVERVGDRVSQLITQGQPRMSVAFEFAVANDRYRVTRSTPSTRGATKILVERLDGGEWRQAGEAADRVREAEPMLARAIGLDYDAFTRSVLLPQGKFSEFLTGDPRKRREIVTELLGLGLFGRMAQRANAVGRDAQLQAATRAELLQREFDDATLQNLAAAKAEHAEAVAREQALSASAERVRAMAELWRESSRSIEEVEACAAAAGAAATTAADAAAALAGLAPALVTADDVLAARLDHEHHAAVDAEAAKAALLEAETTLGSPDALAEAKLHARSLLDLRPAAEELTARRDELLRGSAGLTAAAKDAERLATERAAAVTARQADLASADAALEDARHANLVATASAGLKAGDPCPVCGAPLEHTPAKGDAKALRHAEAGLVRARKNLESAHKAALDAERALDAARRDVQTNAAERSSLEKELAAWADREEEHVSALTVILGDPLPEDPVAALAERERALRDAQRADRDAERALAEASKAHLLAEQERERLASRIERLRDRIAVDHQPLIERAARALGKRGPAVRLPATPKAQDAEPLARFAGKLADALSAFAARLGAEGDRLAAKRDALLERASADLDGLVEPAPTLEELSRVVDAACRTSAAEAATAAQRVGSLKQKIERRAGLQQEVKRLYHRAEVFKQLALELRADRLIAFLQAEALQLLAAAGSARLATLSEGRYRMTCRDDEFLVIDKWNGDDERSVRTLSGGETFLASLSLALALAEQVRSLATTDRARLDSLFLDEGFGTLDADSLRTVTDALEQLGGDGRLVGVITHVPELAEQFPRIVVEKSPRGSKVALVSP